jgi:hypothetical protein
MLQIVVEQVGVLQIVVGEIVVLQANIAFRAAFGNKLHILSS